MRALVWLVQETWQATVEQASALLPGDAEVTLLYVVDVEAQEVARGARAALLGRRPPPGPETERVLEQSARELLEAAAGLIGRSRSLVRRGRPEREVVAAAAGFDLVCLARDGDRRRLGPRSLGPAARFVVDHAPCPVLLIWPDRAPPVSTLPPPRH